MDNIIYAARCAVEKRDDLADVKKLEFDIPVKEVGLGSVRAPSATDSEPPAEAAEGDSTPDVPAEEPGDTDSDSGDSKKRVRPIDHQLDEISGVDEAEIAALLMKFEAENDRYPDYPNWRKGAIWGVLTVLMALWAIYSLYKNNATGASDLSGSILPFFFMLLTLILWLLATFRPGNE